MKNSVQNESVAAESLSEGEVWGIQSAEVAAMTDERLDGWYDTCGCGSTCFPADSMVLMADGSQKAIQTVTVGEKVWGATGVNTVVGTESPILGRRRMLQMEGCALRWSEEHAIWTLRDEAQWWGAHDAIEWEREASMGFFGGLNASPAIRQLSPKGETYAHIDGWKTLNVVEIPADPRTRLYYLRTDRCHTVIVDGFVVSGGVNDADFDYRAMNWNGLDALKKAVAATASIVDTVTEGAAQK